MSVSLKGICLSLLLITKDQLGFSAFEIFQYSLTYMLKKKFIQMFSVWWRKLAMGVILKFTSSSMRTNLPWFLIHNRIEAKIFKIVEQLLPVYVSFPQVRYNPGFLFNCFQWELRLAQSVPIHGLWCEFLQQWAFDGHTQQTWERNPGRRLSFFYSIVLRNSLWRFGSCRY